MISIPALKQPSITIPAPGPNIFRCENELRLLTGIPGITSKSWYQPELLGFGQNHCENDIS